MLALALACVGIGLAPLAFWPALHSAVGAWDGAWASAPAPQSLGTLGLIHLALAVSVVGAGIWLWHRVRKGGLVRGQTWDCGYAAPTARMQYTAGSFAGIITEWFAWILQPVRRVARPEGIFPGDARIEEHTPETVLERVVEPVGRLVMRGSGWVRRLQNGRAQAYLFYLILGLAAVAAMTLVCI